MANKRKKSLETTYISQVGDHEEDILGLHQKQIQLEYSILTVIQN